MKLPATTFLYIANARIPTEKAHGLQIIKMCEAFQRQGMQVELLVPWRFQSAAMRRVADIWAYYDVDTPFRIRRVPAIDFIPCDKYLPRPLMTVLYYLQSLLFAFCALLLTWFRQDGVYYSRDLATILVLGLTRWLHRKPCFFEAHEAHGRGTTPGGGRTWLHSIMRWMMRRVDGIVAITSRLKAQYLTLGLNDTDILVAPDGIDRKRLLQAVDRAEAREKLQISLDRKVVCYTGHLFRWKGVYTLAECRKYLPADYDIVIVGGMDDDVQALRQFIAAHHIPRIRVTGHVPYAAIPLYLGAADVLVVPNTATVEISRDYTSPLKVFEYMAAQRPIVASDLPSLREVLRHGDNAYLVQPDDPAALAEAILMVLRERPLADMLTAAAYHDVQRYTWDTRAHTILEFQSSIP